MSTAARMKAIGFLVSLAIHVSAAAIALPIALSLGRHGAATLNGGCPGSQRTARECASKGPDLSLSRPILGSARAVRTQGRCASGP